MTIPEAALCVKGILFWHIVPGKELVPAFVMVAPVRKVSVGIFVAGSEAGRCRTKIIQK